MKAPQRIRAVIIIFLAVCLLCNSDVTAKGSDAIDKSTPMHVVVCGTPVGIRLASHGVIITGFMGFMTDDNSYASPAKDAGLAEGDRIIAINGESVNNVDEMQTVLDGIVCINGASADITVENDSGRYIKKVKLSRDCETKKYRIGIWAKDTVAGIGTLTFYSEECGMYAALGHAITDGGKKYEISGGSLLKAEITGIKKGVAGTPGELRGYFNESDGHIGNVIANCETGIYGSLDAAILNISDISGTTSTEFRRLAVANNSEIHKGKAYILTSAIGGKPEKYDIEITQINKDSTDGTKSFNIRITDKRLIDTTGGIVQGMSGSPIIQDGKFAGAVTHVMINDPHVGYGIFAMSMINTMYNSMLRSGYECRYDITKEAA